MHGASEQLLQVALQSSLLEQAPPTAHLHQQVHIAAWPRVAPRDRSKHAHHAHAMMCRDALDLIATVAHLFEAWRRAGRARIRIRPPATLELSTEITHPV
jgi:hypothetical protein